MQKTLGRQSRIPGIVSKAVRSRWVQLLVVCLFFALIIYFIDDGFIARGNVRNVLRGLIVPGLMIIAVGPLLAGGGIDLAASAEATLCSLIFVNLLTYTSIPWPLAIIVAIICGGILGLINVFLINVLNFHAFIATIGMTSVYLGFSQMWTGMFDVMIRQDHVIDLGRVNLFNEWIPMLFIFMIVLVAIYIYIMANTRFGRSIYMVGGNQTAARLAGLNPKKVRAVLYINSGAMAALAGCVWSINSRMANAVGISNSMPNITALTAVIIGGVSFMGGSGTLAAGLFGLLLVRLFDNGLVLAGMPSYINTAAQGLILIIALIVDNLSIMRQRRALIAAAMATVDKKSKA